jgi:hypothetical protein
MQGTTVIHQTTTKFGFRTIELRPKQGFYVNGTRILLKGCNRHSFWPDSGRCLSETISHNDIELMKGMNMNAVRMSHYPPDQHFLDDCDSLGLYVLDELPGWQKAYDTTSGTQMVKEMVVRDVNHPSILFWDNGNEGGWNTALDPLFDQWDPQLRMVMHPGGNVPGLIDQHYPSYSSLVGYAGGTTVFLPTEFLHGLYDGGAGSGLANHWDVIRQSSVCGGGFIWAFLDEAVKRVDQGGILDTNGNQAPDGIVGPYRQKEGSYDTIKAVWTPIYVSTKILPVNFKGNVTIQNRYDFLNGNQCTYKWELDNLPTLTPFVGVKVLAKGTAAINGIVPPGTSGTVHIPLPLNWQLAPCLKLHIFDPDGREINTQVWTLPHADDFRSLLNKPGFTQATATTNGTTVNVTCGTLDVQINSTTGMLETVQQNGQTYSLTNGPRLATGNAHAVAMTQYAQGNDYFVSFKYFGNLQFVTWDIHSNGWVTADYYYNLTGGHSYFGVSFDYPEANVQSARWFGMGPYRTWKNRQEGGLPGVWSNAYNDTITGANLWIYPEFKGYFGNVRWLQLTTTEGLISVIVGNDDTFLQLFTPNFPAPGLAGQTVAPFPSAGLSFLNGIPPMGNKFEQASATGPDGQNTVALGTYHGTVSFYFGALPTVILK